MTDESIVAIMLAAGQSSRFGSDKKRFPIDGVPMLQKALSLPLSLGISTLTVLKTEDRDYVEELLADWQHHSKSELCYATTASKGMGNSLSEGVTQLIEKHPNVDGVFIFLADMPRIQTKTILTLLENQNPNKIIVPMCVDKAGKLRQGHPVLFGRRWIPLLRTLHGDAGAKQILRENSQEIVKVVVEDLGILNDYDYPPRSNSHMAQGKEK